MYELYEEVEYDYVAFKLRGSISDHFPGAPARVDAAESFGNFVYLTQVWALLKSHTNINVVIDVYFILYSVWEISELGMIQIDSIIGLITRTVPNAIHMYLYAYLS